MHIALNIPTSFLESVLLDIKEIAGTITDIKNLKAKALTDCITVSACATVNVLMIKQKVNITVALQIQIEDGNIICKNVSARGDNFATTAIVTWFEDAIMSYWNSNVAKSLSSIFVHYLTINTDNIYISFSPR